MKLVDMMCSLVVRDTTRNVYHFNVATYIYRSQIICRCLTSRKRKIIGGKVSEVAGKIQPLTKLTLPFTQGITSYLKQLCPLTLNFPSG